MNTISEILTEWLQGEFERVFPGAAADFSGISAVPSASDEHGDFQCNAAMGLAKTLKRRPRDIAEALASGCERHESLSGIEVAGPGFINMTLSPEWVALFLDRIAGDPRLGAPCTGEGRCVVMDYSSPNVAKPMHIGHIRSTVIGNALDRIHRFLGYRVIADNHLGDWGTQFGILIMGYRNFLDQQALDSAPIDELERIYVLSYNRSREDDEWLARCRREVAKLQAGDADNLALMKRFAELSMPEFEKIYKRLGVSFDLTRGESFYNDRLPAVMERLGKLGNVRESEGAMVAFLDEEKLPPCIVRKSDGAFNYATTDLAALFCREEEFSPDSIVCVTDERQQLHFRQVFAIGARAGVRAKLHHVWFGLMRLPEGTFSTREGNVIKLERLLDEAELRALDVVREASPDMPPEAQKEVARAVGIGAVKYADLSQNPQSLVTFTWDKALALNGNSGPYLQYSYARIRSVQDKYAERFPGKDPETFPIVLGEPSERALAMRLLRFGESAALAARSFKPNVLADYLYDLCGVYNAFYQNVPFLKADEGVRESRVRLCGIVARVLRQGLDLLGIETPERI